MSRLGVLWCNAGIIRKTVFNTFSKNYSIMTTVKKPSTTHMKSIVGEELEFVTSSLQAQEKLYLTLRNRTRSTDSESGKQQVF